MNRHFGQELFDLILSKKEAKVQYNLTTIWAEDQGNDSNLYLLCFDFEGLKFRIGMFTPAQIKRINRFGILKDEVLTN